MVVVTINCRKEIDNMNFENLTVGQVFPSFKALCEHVGINYNNNGGAFRAVCVVKLQKYIEWEHVTENGKTKRALIITKIK